MTFPSLLLALVIALSLGAAYHLMRGGSGWRLILYLGLSAAGFAAGHLIGTWRGWMFLMLGSINLGMGAFGSVMFLLAGDWLRKLEARRKSSV